MEFLCPEHVAGDMLQYFGGFVYTFCQPFQRAALLLKLLGSRAGGGGGVLDPCLSMRFAAERLKS